MAVVLFGRMASSGHLHVIFMRLKMHCGVSAASGSTHSCDTGAVVHACTDRALVWCLGRPWEGFWGT